MKTSCTFVSAIAAILFVSTSALAKAPSVPTQAQIEAAYEKCATQFPGDDSASKTGNICCRLNVDINVNKLRLAAGEAKAQAEVTRLTQELETMRAQLDLAKATAQAPAQARQGEYQDDPDVVRPERPQANPTQVPVRPPPQARHDPAAPAPVVQPHTLPVATGYRVVEAPGRYVASTYEMQGMDSFVRYVQLHLGARKWSDTTSEEEVRLIVLKNGRPLAIAHPGEGGAPVSGHQIYADLDRNGRPDRRPYYAVDLSMVNEVYVGFRKGDSIIFAYVIPTGRLVQVPGMPPQILWGQPVKVQMWVPNRNGKWMSKSVVGTQI